MVFKGRNPILSDKISNKKNNHYFVRNNANPR